MSNKESSNTSITEAQIHPFQVESTEDWIKRIKQEAEDQSKDQYNSSLMLNKRKNFFKENRRIKTVVAGVVAIGLGLIGLEIFTSNGPPPPQLPELTPTPQPTHKLQPTKTPISLPSATSTHEPTATSTATATEVAVPQPHFFENKNLVIKGETIWGNSERDAESYLRTFYGNKYLEKNDDSEVLTVEGKRIAKAMGDGAALSSLLRSNRDLDTARSMGVGEGYQGFSQDGYTLLFEALIAEVDPGSHKEPDVVTNFIFISQRVEFETADKLTQAQVDAGTNFNTYLDSLENPSEGSK